MTQVPYDSLTPKSAEALIREHELVHVMAHDSAGREQKRFTWNKGLSRPTLPLPPAAASAQPHVLTQLDLIVNSPEQFSAAKALAEQIKGQKTPSANAIRLASILLVLAGCLASAPAAHAEGVGAGKYAVWVYKNERGQWVKQPERTFNTNNTKAANDYVAQVNAVRGWTANTNAPESPAESVVGTWVGTVTESDGETYPCEETYYPDGSCVSTDKEGTSKSTWRQTGATITEDVIDDDGGRATAVSTLNSGVLTTKVSASTTGSPATSETFTRKSKTAKPQVEKKEPAEEEE